MRVVINNLTAIRQKTGIGHHITELLRCLRAQRPHDEFVTFPGPWVTAGIHAWGALRKGIGRLKNTHDAVGPQSGRPWLHTVARACTAWHFRTGWANRAFDLYHEPNYIPLPCDRPTVATVHDLSVLLHPQWHPADRVAYFAQHFEAGLRRCAHLLAVSEFTRRELIETFAVRADRVTCTYNGMRPELRPMDAAEVGPVVARLGLPAQYLLHVGTLEPRKNLLLLLRAYGDLPAGLRERSPLVLVGGWGWNATELAEHFHGVARHQGVRHLGYVSDADLPALYNGRARWCFRRTTRASACRRGKCWRAAARCSRPRPTRWVETAGPSAHLVDAADLAGWRDAMWRVIADDDWRDQLRRGGPDTARQFTWERCARDTLRVYGAVLGEPATATQAA